MSPETPVHWLEFFGNVTAAAILVWALWLHHKERMQRDKNEHERRMKKLERRGE